MFDSDGAIHDFFGLTYSNYLVLHRTLLQSMPKDWQAKFVALLNIMDEAFAHIEQPQSYQVRSGVEREVGDMSSEELYCIGYSVDRGDPDKGEEDIFRDPDGNELLSCQRVLWPKSDPVPHYNRGRTYIEPRIDEGKDIVSPCPSCYCMTHTIEGKCEKCGADKSGVDKNG